MCDIDQVWKDLQSECYVRHFSNKTNRKNEHCFAPLDGSAIITQHDLSATKSIDGTSANHDLPNRFEYYDLGDSDDDSAFAVADSTEEHPTNSSSTKTHTTRLERLAKMLHSSDRAGRIEAINELLQLTRSINESNNVKIVPDLNFALPYNLESISLTHRQYGAKVSDLAKGRHVSTWDRWERTSASLSEQFPEKASTEKENGTSMQLSVMGDIEEVDSEERLTLQAILDICGNALFRKFSDPSEKCRHGSVVCIQLLCASGLNIGRHVAYLMPAIFSRQNKTHYDNELKVFVFDMATHDFYRRGGATIRQDREHILSGGYSVGMGETSEEIRLELCDLLNCIIRSCTHLHVTSLLDAYFSDMIHMLTSSLGHPFLDLKVKASYLLVQILRHPSWESGAKHFATGIARAALPNLRHRNSKVRMASLDLFETSVSVPDREKVRGAGTEAIIDLVGFRDENVLPIAAFYRSDCGTTVNCLAELVTDGNRNVRMRCCDMLSFFICCLPDRYDHIQRLLPYLLSFHTDDCQEIRERALAAIDICGQYYEAENTNDIIERRQYGIDGDTRCNHNDPLPSPFKSRPRIGARLFVRGNTKRFLDALLNELCNWTSGTRKQSAQLMSTLVIYCEESLTMDFHNTLAGIVKALRKCRHTETEGSLDKESQDLQNNLEILLITLGRYVDPEVYVPLLSKRIQVLGNAESATSFAEGGVQSALSCAANAFALRCLMKGSLPERMLPHTSALGSSLCQPNIPSHPILQSEYLSLLEITLERIGRDIKECTGTGTAGILDHGGRRIILDCICRLRHQME